MSRHHRYWIACFIFVGSVAMLCLSISEAAEAPVKPKEKAKLDVFRYPPIDMTKVSEVHTYREVDDVELKLYVFRPEGVEKEEKRAGIVFFFGGGWKSGSPGQFWKQCEYLASRGMVAITADYRVKKRHGVAAVKCVEDANAAMRWVRTHADMLGLDEQRLAASGGSAGGHLAAACAIFGDVGYERGYDSGAGEVRKCLADLLVLYNPVMSLLPVGEQQFDFDREMLRERMGTPEVEDLSPYHHVREGLPTTLMMFGEKDVMLLGWANEYIGEAKALGNDVRLQTWPNRGHGFFNYGRGTFKVFKETMLALDAFLVEHSYLEGEADENRLDEMDWRKS
ncbi:alpha/beta hydrolase [Poriferisphaera sp. WC338]|uniref:alpha/beta hydrolase n=1 Tax=Poriferisphaera sp. WC338 TaxID=3425129 RepID=UPI003D817F46